MFTCTTGKCLLNWRSEKVGLVDKLEGLVNQGASEL